MQMDTGPTTTTMATDGNHDLGHRIESAYRGVYKIHGSVLSPSSLREKVRQRCLAKMSSTRAELVQRFRAGGDVSSYVRDVVFSDLEEEGIQHSDLYDGQTPEAWLQFMTELERQIMADLEQQQADEVLRHEAEEVAALTEPRVPCPLCQVNALGKHDRMVYCRCGLRIDLQFDDLSLEQIHRQLLAAVAAHAEICNSAPAFQVRQFGSHTVLALVCTPCGTLDVVL